jgi:hypothetical protein
MNILKLDGKDKNKSEMAKGEKRNYQWNLKN